MFIACCNQTLNVFTMTGRQIFGEILVGTVVHVLNFKIPALPVVREFVPRPEFMFKPSDGIHPRAARIWICSFLALVLKYWLTKIA